ncbi:MAG TPA: hypothetical protein VL461_08935 [Dictyobacter sp.]|jgi:hypothetical protein|nr:hypothetical protein [Dictyobacter sp.]
MKQNTDLPNNHETTQQGAQQLEKSSLGGGNFWSILCVIILGAFIILAIGGYAFNWTWTGFRGNTLWNWLQLLILPVMLAIASIWLTRRPQWQKQWTILLIIIGIVFIVLVIGGYAFNWTWTGFRGNTLWDWLQMLVLPIVLTITTAWFSVEQVTIDHTNRPLTQTSETKEVVNRE